MFPVDHLPRNGGEQIASAGGADESLKNDKTLALLEPLLKANSTGGSGKSSSEGSKKKVDGASSSSEAGPSRWSVGEIQDIKSNLERAIVDNKKRNHDLLISNFPSVSSHIRIGEQARQDYQRISTSVKKLERDVDPNDEAVSFIPPVIKALDRHHSAQVSRHRSQAHTEALRKLSEQVELVQRLEEALWAGKGADQWVTRALLNKDAEAGDLLRGTKIQQAIDTRLSTFRSMVNEQLSDSFKACITFDLAKTDSRRLIVKDVATLQQPKLPRKDAHSSRIKPSKPPPYPLSHIYTTLSQFSALAPLLHNIQTQLIRDIVLPAMTNGLHVTMTHPDSTTTLIADRSDPALSPSKVLDGISTILTFVSDQLFPDASSITTVQSTPDPTPTSNLQERSTFLTELQTSIYNLMLQHVILPAMPSTISSIPSWLELVHHAVTIESEHTSKLPVPSALVIGPFFDVEAGKAWADQRRKRVDEETRKLILAGWGGWEAVECSREKEVITIVEVEISDDEAEEDHPQPDRSYTNGKGEGGKGKAESRAGISQSDSADFGWGFDDEKAQDPNSIAPKGAEEQEQENGDKSMDVDDGWGFDDSSASAGPSKPSPKKANPAPVETPDEEVGWDFDMDPSPAPPSAAEQQQEAPTAASAPAKIAKPAKPAREAKRLGKKVAKQKHAEDDDDPWANIGTDKDPERPENELSSASSLNGATAPGSASDLPQVEASSFEKAKTSQNPVDEPMDDWSWGDNAEAPGSSRAVPKKKRKKILKEEKKMITETFLISRACDKLLDAAERVLRESREMSNTTLPSPSFAAAENILTICATDIFEIYRSLLPTHFAAQIRDVPALAMQLHNDARHLATKIAKLSEQYSFWSAEDIVHRMNGLADHIFESQLSTQKQSLMETLDEADMGDASRDAGYKSAEKAVNSVVHIIESLAKVLKTVLPSTAYYSTLGYLLNETVRRISAHILGLQDITEVESNRLNDLLKLIYPLEEVFVLEPGQPSMIVAQVPHWLKFCYISELLSASLVDILYLFETGALVDFTTEELVGMIRALFADSEKRDNVIEKIEAGSMAQQGPQEQELVA